MTQCTSCKQNYIEGVVRTACPDGCKPPATPERVPEHITLIGFMAAKLAIHEPGSGTVKWALDWLERNSGT